MRTVLYGVGINDYEGHVFYTSTRSNMQSYNIWKAMLQRCYCTKLQAKYTTYMGCTVCDEWKYFKAFKLWFDANYVESFQLDKDILVEGNKIYSPETCRFIPDYLNSVLNDCRSSKNNNLPFGVFEDKPNRNRKKNTTYRAVVSNGHGKRLSRTFKTIEEASTWRTETKKQVVKEQAIRAFLDNAIKTDIYLALVRRRFDSEFTGTQTHVTKRPEEN